MSRLGQERPWEDRLRSLERAAQARARGERVPMPEARAPACEVCGSAEVLWGALCAACRDRLRAAGQGPPG